MRFLADARRLLVALAVALLAGCATPDASLIGADRAAVLARHGNPAERFPSPGGGERWLYPLGGLQQYVWAVELDAAGRVTEVIQVRSAEEFAKVRIDVDTAADIRRRFGVPRLSQPFPLTGQVAWMYPWVENRIWNMEMAIYFDAQGIVRRIENGPDPRFIGGGDRRH